MKAGKSRGVPLRKVPAEPEIRSGGFRSKPYLAAGLALFFLTLLAFSNSFRGGFVLDNRGLILNDPRLRDATAANLRLIFHHTYWWPTGEGGVYRPFATLSYLFNYAVLGNRDRPGGYHWINFLLHAVNVFLVYTLTLRFVRRLWPAFLIAAMWAVHPVLTESVTNIVGRADLLAATSLLAGFLMYLKSAETHGWQRWAWLAGLTTVTALGVFSKENAAVVPAEIVIYELTFRKRQRWGRVMAGLLATLAPIAAMFYQRSAVLAASLPKEVPFTDNPILGAGFWPGRLTAIGVLARYLWLMVWPARLSGDYSWSQIPVAQGSFGDWIALMVVLSLIPAMALLYRRNRGAFFLACFASVWMAPVANLLFPIGTIMAERFLYVPALAAIVCVVLGIFAAAERARAAPYQPVVLCLLVTATLAARTWTRNSDWQDDLSMATASVETSPDSYKPHDLLANVLFASDPDHANIDRVIRESEKSLAILDPLPDYRNVPDPYRLAGMSYLYRGDLRKAIAALLRFLAIEKAGFAAFKRTLGPGGPSAESAERTTAVRQGDGYTLLSMAYFRSGDTGSAADAAGHARALNPLSPQLYRQLAGIALAAGRMDDAAVTLIEGAFVTSDGSLRQALVELYQRAMDRRSCALIQGPRGPAINPACPAVHAHLCAAAPGTIRTLARTDQRELARTKKIMFVEEFGCPKAPLDQALP